MKILKSGELVTEALVRTLVILVFLASHLLVDDVAAQEDQAPPRPVVEVMSDEAVALRPFVETKLARRFLEATKRLPPGEARTIYRDPEDKRRFYAAAAVDAMEQGARERLEAVELEEAAYYTTRYGSPLAYCRALDIAGRHGLTSFEDRKVLDFGYGTVGHLRLMALNGAEAVGVDVDSYLTALYSHPTDVGALSEGKKRGSVRLVDGHWPGEVGETVGQDYDLFLSKNTLKRGYVHPEREADPSRLLQLGVDDAAYLRAVYEALAPGGLMVVYNLSPKQNPPDKPYIPWADGRFPFARDLVEHTGFQVREWDVVDDEAARRMARHLGWDKAGMDVDTSLFAHYTVLRKPLIDGLEPDRK